MFKITPIGSCRIFGPLRECGKALGFQINAKRIFGYAHSSAEAVQQMHALAAGFTLEPQLWPLISRSKEFERFQAEIHQKSHLYIVELCSAKTIKIGDTAVQLNHLNALFSDFFSDKKRALAFTQLCMKNDPAGVAAFLADSWSHTPEQRKDSEVLKRIKMSMSTEQTLYEDICKLQEGLPDVVIVTHVNAKVKNSKPLLSRETYIHQVVAASQRANVTLYNPTDLMNVVGQNSAIEDHSTALAHYTSGFNRQIFSDWFSNILLPKVKKAIQDAPEAGQKAMLPAIVDGVLKSGTSEQVEQLTALLADLDGYDIGSPRH